MLPSTQVTGPAGTDAPGEPAAAAGAADDPADAPALAGGFVPPPPHAVTSSAPASAATTSGPRDLAIRAGLLFSASGIGRPPAGLGRRPPAAPLASSS